MANYLIIAASSTIGQATVELLQQTGHRVYKTARSRDKIEPDYVLDASDFDAMGQVFQQVKQDCGSLDGVVCFAGSLFIKPIYLTDRQHYEHIINSSLTTAFATVHSAAKYMEQGGSVVLISSAAASIGIPHHEAIAAAKAGVIGLMRSAAASYAPNNLRFNVVAPGLIDTALTQDIVHNERALQYSLNFHPLRRVGQVGDIARAVAFLLAPENSWITGEVMHIDGGLSHLKTAVTN